MIVAIAIERGAVINAQSFDRSRSTVWNRSRTKHCKQRKYAPARLPIAIGPQVLSAWSWGRVTWGSGLKGACGRGARPYNKVGIWVFRPILMDFEGGKGKR